MIANPMPTNPPHCDISATVADRQHAAPHHHGNVICIVVRNVG